MASDPMPGASFGAQVSLSGNKALIGAPKDHDTAPYSGAAYVFVRSATAWVEQAKLKASDGATEDFFGSAVSLSGDSALIGVAQDDDHGPYSGSAYVFVRTGSTWIEQAKLPVPDGAAWDLFGHSVSLSGDTALVGAYRDDDKGSAYVFDRDGASWSPVAKLLASDGAAADDFGWSVALNGDTALVGASMHDGNGSDSGAAYVFVRTGSSWTEEAKLTASDGAPQNGFGTAVSLSANMALIASRQGVPSTAAYVFVRNGTKWTEQAKLTASDGNGNKFGSSVSLPTSLGFGARPSVLALIGANKDDDKGYNSGAAYLFERSGTDWTERAKLTASDGSLGDSFGAAVSLVHNTALIGAWANDEPAGADVGSAYVFDISSDPSPASYCTSKPGLVCGVPVLSSSGSPSATTTTGFVLDARPALGTRTGICIYTNRGRANAPFQGGTLCLEPAIHRSIPVHAGGSPGGCDGVFSIDWNAFAHGALGGNPKAFLLVPGQQVNVQVWGRDTIATGSFLSDALEYFVCD